MPFHAGGPGRCRACAKLLQHGILCACGGFTPFCHVRSQLPSLSEFRGCAQGCTVPEIATITGHSLKTVDSILERYLSRTRQLADAAISTLENASRTKAANQVQTGRYATGSTLHKPLKRLARFEGETSNAPKAASAARAFARPRGAGERSEPGVSEIMARPKRFELLTPRFVVWSRQLISLRYSANIAEFGALLLNSLRQFRKPNPALGSAPPNWGWRSLGD